MKLAQKIVVGYFRASLNMMAVISPTWAAKRAFRIFCTPRRRVNQPFPTVFKHGEAVSFLHQGKQIRGFRWNKGADKRLLVLHGYESSCRKFDHHISRSIKLGYEVLAFDAPAHGASEGKSVHVLQYADMIGHVANLYGSIDTFICHSFGGIALSQYLEKADHNQQTRVVLIAPATETTTAIDSFFTFLQLNDRIRKSFDSVIEKLSGRPPQYFSIRRAIDNVKARILWIHDEEDQVTPIKDVQKVMDQGYDHIEFLITKGLGHNRIYRDNEVKKKIFTFIS